MTPKPSALLLSFLLAWTASADPIAEVRAAVGKLTGRDSIRATYEVAQVVESKGKLDNEAYSGKVIVELEGDASAFRVVVPRAVLDQIEREQQAKARRPEESTPTVSALSEIDPGKTSDAIDFAPVLLRMLDGAKLVSDTGGTFQGKPVRILVMRAADKLDNDDAKRMKVTENRLTLWVGPDMTPLGAEHIVNAKFSFLIFRAEFKDKKSWYFARVGDRLVRTRRETSEHGSGMGQNMAQTTVATVRVHP